MSLSDLTSDVIGKPAINGNQLTCTTSARGDRDDDEDEEDDITTTRTGGEFKATIYYFTYFQKLKTSATFIVFSGFF